MGCILPAPRLDIPHTSVNTIPRHLILPIHYSPRHLIYRHLILLVNSRIQLGAVKAMPGAGHLKVRHRDAFCSIMPCLFMDLIQGE